MFTADERNLLGQPGQRLVLQEELAAAPDFGRPLRPERIQPRPDIAGRVRMETGAAAVLRPARQHDAANLAAFGGHRERL